MTVFLPNVPEEEYRKMQGLSSTEICDLAISSAHWKNAEFKHSGAMELGVHTHCVILQPALFKLEDVGACDDRCREGSPAWHAAVSKARHQVLAMRNSVLEALPDLFVSDGFDTRETEITATNLIDAGQGLLVPIKCRWDLLINRSIGVDLKTTSARTLAEVYGEIWKWHYPLKAVHYSQVYGVKQYFWVFVSKVAPYGVWAVEFPLSEENQYYVAAKERWEKAIANYGQYLLSGEQKEPAKGHLFFKENA